MSRFLYSLAILTLMSLLASCGKLDFTPSARELSFSGIKLAARLTADPASDRLTVNFSVKNTSQQLVNVDYSQSQLMTEEGYIGIIEDFKAESSLLLPGKSAAFSVTYSPINSTYTHQRIGWAGDVRSFYRFKTDFIRDANGITILDTNIDFRMEPAAHQNYLKTAGIEKDLRFYVPDLDIAAFINGQAAYYRKTFSSTGQQHSHDEHRAATNAETHEEEEGLEADATTPVFVSGDEFILDRITFKSVFYRYRDQLKLYFTIINRGDRPALLYPQRFVVSSMDKKLKPVNDISDLKKFLTPMNKETGKDVLVIGQNDRAAFTLKYQISGKFDHISLASDFIQDSKKRNLLFRDLPYVLTNITIP